MWSGIYNQDGTPAYRPDPNAKPMKFTPAMLALQAKWDAEKKARAGQPIRPRMSREQLRQGISNAFEGPVNSDGTPRFNPRVPLANRVSFVNPAFQAQLNNTNAVNYKPNSQYTPPFKTGGTNIMGGPILPIYQDAGTFTSSASTPEEPNFAQQVLGPLFNYIPEEEEVDIPVSTSKTFEVSSPQKGFKDYSELDKFITDSKELIGADITPLYDAYSGALTGITALKKALINGDVPMDLYQKEK